MSIMKRVLLALFTVALFVVNIGANCHPQPILADLAKCEEAAAAKDLPALLPVVGSIILSGGTNAAMDAALIGIAVQFGVDSVDCAVAALKAAWEQISTPASQPETVTKAIKALPTVNKAAADHGVKRATAWLGTRGKSLKSRSVTVTP